ncbi:hypothetical protein K6U06_11980 [Acidiferrimicrobium sp. IK]|uniref:hypothetical protein n=1 Tax=Acidiferrimicrobium sp. IK TaxID=2871700 RepID=UPI0021CB0FE0|nr:hypothetical protein [Acidiferrimicrobium sp. IK]MCU4185083.1 hypothetical protein [Acidiferrimicrobium sp. IK]
MAVINVSEGRDRGILADLAAATGPALLDLHSDGDHHRSVFTLGGPQTEAGARGLTARAVSLLDITAHQGAHPRIGVVDVVPWVTLVGRPLAEGPLAVSLAERDRFARWAADSLGVPSFLYGPGGRSLPEVRRHAWREAMPDVGPPRPHPTAGAMAVGARGALVAYNLWLAEPDLPTAQAIARSLRGGQLRCLGLRVGDAVQVSCNLIDPWRVGPGAVFDAVASRAGVARAELVGLLPAAVLAAEPAHRWAELDLDPGRTIEARLEQAGLDGGSGG